jgi:hypothetical protein
VTATGSCLFAYVRILHVAHLGLKASREFFSGFMDSVFKAPMLFFDSTPTGRIMIRVRYCTCKFLVKIYIYLDVLFFLIFCPLNYTGLVRIEHLILRYPIYDDLSYLRDYRNSCHHSYHDHGYMASSGSSCSCYDHPALHSGDHLNSFSLNGATQAINENSGNDSEILHCIGEGARKDQRNYEGSHDEPRNRVHAGSDHHKGLQGVMG